MDRLLRWTPEFGPVAESSEFRVEAGERSAIVFTVIEACRRRGIDPFEYLRDVFTRMPTMAAQDYASLAPEEWAKARTPAKHTRKAPAADANNQQRRCA